MMRCEGAGEIEFGTRQDEDGNWDTSTLPCPGCPDCESRCGVCDMLHRREDCPFQADLLHDQDLMSQPWAKQGIREAEAGLWSERPSP